MAKAKSIVKKTTVKKAVKKKAPVKFSVTKKVTKTKVVRAKPAAKVIENSAVTRAPKRTGIRLVKKIQTAEGWKREQKRIRAKK